MPQSNELMNSKICVDVLSVTIARATTLCSVEFFEMLLKWCQHAFEFDCVSVVDTLSD